MDQVKLTATVEPLRPAPLSISIILKLLKRATDAAIIPNIVGRHLNGTNKTGTWNTFMMTKKELIEIHL